MDEVTIKISARHIIIDSSTILDHASIIIHNGKVAETGPTESLRSIKADKVVNLRDHILHPGFINAHCHLDLSCLKGKLKRGLSFTDWIRALVHARSKVSAKDLDRGIKQGVARLMQTGTTCVGDITSSSRVNASLIRSGLRAVVFHETLGYDPGVANERFSDLLKRVGGASSSDLVENGVSPHSIYSVSPKLMKKTAAYAKRDKAPLSIHLSETAEEVEFSRKGDGPFRELLESFGLFATGRYPKATPVNAVNKTGALKKSLVVHMNHPCKGDLATIKKAGAKIVICPNSNRWLQRPISAPVYEILDRDIPLALGTDSLASNTDLDMTAEIRGLLREFPDIALSQAFDIATVGGAKALSLPKICGTLQKGAPFDAVAVKIKSFRKIYPMRAIISGRRRVDAVWVAGAKLRIKREGL
ncbi:hypothetical protein MNBD_NITROSPINAE04-961 [hydrothermal vent metagenome]|uniref:Amidohydrolase-related domain-containing protein n=1 Tax=hydrothermal vent metagenome TaxID=652676 RepID=A0A3B1CFG9_9ZZZZ